MLGVDAALGRLPAAADEIEGAPESILLSSALWQRRFGGDPGIVGRTIAVDGRPVQVLGVLPPGFRLLMPADAGIPDTIEAYQLFGEDLSRAPRGQQFLRVVGRMKRGVPIEQARLDVSRVGDQLSAEFPEYRGRPRLPPWA